MSTAWVLEEVAAGLLFIATDAEDARVIAFNQRFVEMWRIDDATLRSSDAMLRHIARRTRGGTLAVGTSRELREGGARVMISTLELEDGRVFELSTRTQLAAGRVIGRVLSFRDVTAQRRA